MHNNPEEDEVVHRRRVASTPTRKVIAKACSGAGRVQWLWMYGRALGNASIASSTASAALSIAQFLGLLRVAVRSSIAYNASKSSAVARTPQSLRTNEAGEQTFQNGPLGPLALFVVGSVGAAD